MERISGNSGRTSHKRLTAFVLFSTEIPKAPGYYVYRLWADDECVYVGRIGNSGPRPPQIRLNVHRRRTPWWPDVTRIEIAELPDHPAMVAEEYRQIQDLRPRHNVQGTICSHDLSRPDAFDPSDGGCRMCDRERSRRPNMSPARVAKARQRDRDNQPQKTAARRRARQARRAPGSDQGSLW